MHFFSDNSHRKTEKNINPHMPLDKNPGKGILSGNFVNTSEPDAERGICLMPKMIPRECDLNKRPMSEQTVFHAAADKFSNDWYIFHSFDFVTRDRLKKRWDGEIDFLFYHPQKGFAVMEVKGGAISCRNGQWYQEDRKIDPFGQARGGKYAVKQLLEDSLGRKLPLKFAHCVCFPSCGMETVWPAEAQGIVLTGTGLPNIEQFIIRILDEAQIPHELAGMPPPPAEDILRVLSPYFEYGKRLGDKIGIEEKQFFLLTEQQCRLLELLDNFKRLRIRGCAGSGKTILAVKKARRLAADGARVLLLCYNQLLAERLRKEVEDIHSIKAAAFFEFCIETLQIPENQVGKYRSNPKLYSKTLPQLLKTFLQTREFSCDALIVDEGQDFAPEAWEVISMLVPAGNPFYIFYDPDQNIFTQEVNLPDFGIPDVQLKWNCRNTKRIFEALKPFQSGETKVLDSSPEGSAVRILRGNCRNLLEEELERLVMTEKVPLQDIVILGAHRLEHTSIGTDLRVGRFNIVERSVRLGAMEIAYYTYMKFKGCESKVVILFEVSDSDERWQNKNGLNTAMSRAVHELVILRSE